MSSRCTNHCTCLATISPSSTLLNQRLGRSPLRSRGNFKTLATELVFVQIVLRESHARARCSHPDPKHQVPMSLAQMDALLQAPEAVAHGNICFSRSRAGVSSLSQQCKLNVMTTVVCACSSSSQGAHIDLDMVFRKLDMHLTCQAAPS